MLSHPTHQRRPVGPAYLHDWFLLPHPRNLLRRKMTFLFLPSLLLLELALSASLTCGYSKYVYKAIKIITVFMVTWDQSLENISTPEYLFTAVQLHLRAMKTRQH